jgi:hypothetical protein
MILAAMFWTVRDKLFDMFRRSLSRRSLAQ